MLHTPVNAYPHNVTVDVEHPIPFNFTHTGSSMNYCKYTIYDTNNTTPLSTHWVTHTNDVYNGDMVCAVYQDTTNIVNGASYKWTVTQYQDAYDIYTARAQVQWDAFIRYAYTDQNTQFMAAVPEGVTFTSIDQFIPVAYQTTGIEQPVYQNGELIGGQYLEINGERRLIIGYWESYVLYLLFGFRHDPETPYTSAIIVDSPFTTYPAYDPLTPNVRIPYRIFKNYLVSPFFYFKARTTPETTLSASYSDGVLACSSTYTQENGSLVSSYSWKVSSYSDDYSSTAVASGTVQSSSDINTLIAANNVVDNSHIPITTGLTTIPIGNNIAYFGTQYGKIIAYNSTTGIATLESPLHNFPTYGATVTVYTGTYIEDTISTEMFTERLSKDFLIYPMSGTKRAELSMMTNDGIRYLASYDYTFPAASATEIIESVTVQEQHTDGQCFVQVSWTLNDDYSFGDYKFNVYRSVDGGSFKPIAQNWALGADETECKLEDHLVGAEHSYKYCVIPITASDSSTAGAEVQSETISVHYIGWMITSVVKSESLYDSVIYRHGDTWSLNIDLSDTDIVHNTDRAYLTGGGQYPKMTQSPMRYVTGGISCTIGEIECSSRSYNGSISKLEQWRKFLLDNKLFLLRSSKGDCRLVTIDANPSESYGTGKFGSYIPVMVKFNYTEVGTTENMIVR